jgi:hypothetical protein
MLGPFAEDSTGALWMATLTSGNWSDSKISTLSPTGTGSSFPIQSVDCLQADECIVGVVGPGNITPGFVTYNGSWGALIPTAVVPNPQETGTGLTYDLPSLSCLSIMDCIAAVDYGNYGDLQEFNGSSWSAVDGTLTPAYETDAAWTSVSCPALDECLATSPEDITFQHDPLQTTTSITASQVGPHELDLQATVTWPVLSTSAAPGPLTYEFDGQTINGCDNVAPPSPAQNPLAYPDCDVAISGTEFSFSASVASTSYFIGSLSPPTSGTLGPGYWEIGDDGSVYPFGSGVWYGDASGSPLNAPIVGGAVTPPFDLGYWLVAADGGVFSYGEAPFYGSTGNIHLNKPVVGMAATPDGGGYWFVATDGGIFAYGDAGFYGSTGAIHLNQPVVGMAATPDGRGYWLVAADGGIFALGDAGFYGSTGAIHLNQPVVGMAATPDGRGYWLVAADGGIFAFGDAGFYGSTGAIHLNQPVVGMAATPDGRGYWFVAADGGIFAFGDAPYEGSEGGQPIPGPISGLLPT